jgi:3-hydroxymyristoyl/3-hydroxydecanoyl-(acyl carrier protein) dehydratase
VIESIIPHRDPFLFLDEVLELEPGVPVVRAEGGDR